jgi:hypothetical protein
MHRRILVMSCLTLGSPATLACLRERASEAPTDFTLLLPGGRRLPTEALAAACEAMRAAGLRIEVALGDPDPMVAVREAWVPDHYDEVVVMTWPARCSRWLALDLPYRVQRLTGVCVSHVIAPEELPRAAA